MKKFKFLATRVGSVRKNDVDIVDPRHISMQKVQVNPHKGQSATKTPQQIHKDWWEGKNLKQQQDYHKKHPKSRKKLGGHGPKEHEPKEEKEDTGPINDNTVDESALLNDDDVLNKKTPEAQLRDGREFHTVKWPAGYQPLDPDSDEGKAEQAKYEQKLAEHKKISEQMAEKALHKNSAVKSNDPGLAFLMRFGKITQSKKQISEMSDADKKQYKEDLQDWQSNFGKLDAEDFAAIAKKHYSENREHAIEDGVDPGPLSDAYDSDKIDEDEVTQEKENAVENNDPKVKDIFEQAYNGNPFANLSDSTVNKLTGKAVKKIASAFSGEENQIISNTYQFLNRDQIDLLDKAAQAALQENLTAINRRMMPIRRKRLLKILFVTVAVAAGLATGGVPLGLLCMQHSLLLSGNEGKTHEVIWNALRGKNADGSDDPDFDPHDDAIEKIVRSLKKQLYNTDDEQEQAQLEEVIDNLEEQQDHYHQTKLSGGRSKPKSKLKKHK